MDLKLLGNYYIWAEEHLRQKIAELSNDELNQKPDGFGRSIRDLIEHISVTYESYFHEPLMETWTKLSEEAKNMSREELMNTWKSGTSKFAQAIIDYEKPDFIFPVSKEKSLTLDKEDYFLLYTDHQTYHRGQIMTLLKYLGSEGVNTDYFTFMMSGS